MEVAWFAKEELAYGLLSHRNIWRPCSAASLENTDFTIVKAYLLQPIAVASPESMWNLGTHFLIQGPVYPDKAVIGTQPLIFHESMTTADQLPRSSRPTASPYRLNGQSKHTDSIEHRNCHLDVRSSLDSEMSTMLAEDPLADNCLKLRTADRVLQTTWFQQYGRHGV